MVSSTYSSERMARVVVVVIVVIVGEEGLTSGSTMWERIFSTIYLVGRIIAVSDYVIPHLLIEEVLLTRPPPYLHPRPHPHRRPHSHGHCLGRP